MSDAPELDGRIVHLRPLVTADADRLLALLADPTVLRWWGHYDRDRIAHEFFEADDSVVFAIEFEGQFAGVIQFGEELDPMYHHASIDIALGEPFQGRGAGPDAIRALARYLFTQRGHHRITIDPAAANTNAIKAYERVGFKPIGLMRQYERGPDGAWHDGLLMDLLAGELTA